MIRIGIMLALMCLAGLTACSSSDDVQVSTVVIRPPTDARVQPLWSEDVATQENIAARAQGLVTYNDAGEIVPGLAESWVVTDDGLSYIFRIRQIDWPNGKKVTAAEAARALRTAFAGANRTGAHFALGDVADIVAMTDRVIEIRLRRPQSYFLQILALPRMGILSGGQGTGPFTVIRDKDGRTVLKRRFSKEMEKAFDESELEKAKQIFVTDTPARALVRYQSGQSNLLLGGTFQTATLALTADIDDAFVRRDPTVGLFGLLVSEKSEALDGAEARKALAMAIDRAAFVARVGLKGWPVQESILPFAIGGAFPQAKPDWAGLNKDDRRARARALLGTGLSLKIVIPTSAGGRLAYAQLRGDFARVGVRLNRAAPGEAADLIFTDAVAEYSAAGWYLSRLACGSGFKCSKQADAHLASARAAEEGQARGAFLASADRALTDAQIFIPIAPPLRWSIAAPQMAGFRENSTGFHNLAWVRTAESR